MSDWLSELRAALDRCDRPIEIFFRNDDAGWSDAALRSLFEIFRAESVPLDLAVIPQALSATMAAG